MPEFIFGEYNLEGRDPKLIKIYVPLPEGWHGSAREHFWAEKLAEDKFVIKNIPFLAFGLNFLDEVHARVDEDGLYRIQEVTRTSGHSTYRIMLLDEEKPWMQAWKQIHKLGCKYEEGQFGSVKLLAVDVPPRTNIRQVFELLEKAARQKVWDFEEAAVGHTLTQD